VILGGGVAVCLLLSAHRAVIFAIAQLSCFPETRWLHPVILLAGYLAGQPYNYRSAEHYTHYSPTCWLRGNRMPQHTTAYTESLKPTQTNDYRGRRFASKSHNSASAGTARSPWEYDPKTKNGLSLQWPPATRQLPYHVNPPPYTPYMASSNRRTEFVAQLDLGRCQEKRVNSLAGSGRVGWQVTPVVFTRFCFTTSQHYAALRNATYWCCNFVRLSVCHTPVLLTRKLCYRKDDRAMRRQK